MPTWSELQDELNQVKPEKRGNFIVEKSRQSTMRIADLYERNILYYASGFLQKPLVSGLFTSINMEDINGFMAGIHGHEADKGLLLIPCTHPAARQKPHRPSWTTSEASLTRLMF